ncbi:MAG: TldD/PmbA family protein [Nitrospirae bacterium]|nr:TldD/PmbA family protein [Nitrospirota bacterium]
MLDRELLSKIIKKTLSKGGDYADVFVEWRQPTYIQLEDKKIEKVVSGTEFGVGIRLLWSGKTAYAYCNDVSRKTLLETAGILGKAIKSTPSEHRVIDLDLRIKTPSLNFQIKLPPEGIAMERKINLVRSANDTAWAVDKRIKQVSVIYRDSVQKVQVATSEAEIAEDERIHTVFIINVVAEEDGIIQTGYETAGGLIGFELFDETPVEGLSIKAGGRAIMMLKARRAPAGRMPAIVSSEAGGTMIHEAIGHGIEADLAEQGLSSFSGKIGTQVASSLITVIDDSTLPNKRGSFRFDDEGTPSQRTVLVKDGVLISYMHDKLTAMKAGVSPTGNGRRQSYEFRPIPRMTNTFIASGISSSKDVLKATKNGLFVKKMGGGQVNTITGDFVFDVLEGYLIEEGSIGEPVRGATLTGNGPEVLMSIDMVSSDLGFSIGTCGKDSQGVPVSDAMPTVRIPEIVVGGEALPSAE